MLIKQLKVPQNSLIDSVPNILSNQPTAQKIMVETQPIESEISDIFTHKDDRVNKS